MHESLMYLVKNKVTELEKKFDSEIIQTIDVMEYLQAFS
jgi:hypothetical protein